MRLSVNSEGAPVGLGQELSEDGRDQVQLEQLYRPPAAVTRHDVVAVTGDNDRRQETKALMLAAIWQICLSLWMRALRGLGLSCDSGTLSTLG